MTDVFISYSRKNSEFARRLTDKLRQSGKESWVDWEGIPLSSPNWWGEIQTGIDKADNFVFIMSPDSMSSVVCNMELDYALDHNKRVVIVVYQDVERTETFASLAEYIPDTAMEERLGDDTPLDKARDNWTRISHINWLFFRETDNFDDAYQKLLDTVATDLDYVKSHTRYLDRAQEWIRSDKREDLLLFGDEIALGEAWLKRGMEYAREAEQRSSGEKLDVVNPLPDALHHDYIAASRAAEDERQRRLQELEDSRKKSEAAAETANQSRKRAQIIGAVAGVIGVIAILAGVFAGFQAVDANNQAQAAASTADRAEIVAATADANRVTAVAAIDEANAQITAAVEQQATLAVEAQEAAATADGAQLAAAQALEAQGTANAQITAAVDQQATLAVQAQEAAATADGAQVAAAQAIEAQGTANAQITQAVNQQATLAAQANDASTQVADANILLAAVTPTLNAVATTIREVENFASSAQLAARADTIYNRGNSQPLGLTLAMEATYIDTPAIVSRTLQDIAYLPSARVAFEAHDEWVLNVAVSPDGELAASGDREQLAFIWDISTGRVVHSLEAHDNAVLDVAFSLDGSLLATASQDGSVILWNVENGDIEHVLDEHTEAVNAIAFSPDGQTLASVSDDMTIRLWNIETGDLTQELTYDRAMLDVAFSPFGTLLITGSEDAFLSFWNLENGELIEDRRDHTDAISSVAFSPDGQLIATGSFDTTIKLWKLSQRDPIATLSGHTLSVRSIAFSPDARQLVSGGEDQVVNVWNVDTRQIDYRYRGHGGWIRDVTFSADGQRILSAADDDAVYVWDKARGDLVLELTNRSVAKMAVSADRRLAATISQDNRIIISDMTTGDVLRYFGDDIDGDHYSLSLTSDGSRVVSGLENGLVAVWDVDSGDKIHEWDLEASFVQDVEVSPDDSIILVVTLYGTVAILDMESGDVLFTSQSDLSFLRAAAFTPDGSQFAIAGRESIFLVDLASLEALQTFQGFEDDIVNVIFNADGSQLFSSGSDANVRRWDAATGEQMQVYTGHNSEVFGLSLSPDGTEIVAGSDEGTILRWDVESAELLQSISAHQTRIEDVFHTPDGQMIISSETGGTIKSFRLTSLPETQQWVLDNRYLPELLCSDRLAQGVIPCVDNRQPELPAIVLPEPPAPIEQTSIVLEPIDLTPEADFVAQSGVNTGNILAGAADFWLYEGYPNGLIDLLVESEEFDTVIFIIDETNATLNINDDLNESTRNSGFSLYRLPPSGVIYIAIEGYDEDESGSYTLTITD